MSLAALVRDAARQTPAAIAVRAPDGVFTYEELDALADRAAVSLRRLGVVAGDRVGILLPKSGRSVAAMQAVLRVGAAYVPLDVVAPAARTATIVADAGIRVIFAEDLELAAGVGGRVATFDAEGPAPADAAVRPDDLAYILYTSGSTGTPKGVMISHANALAFVAWAASELAIVPEDRIANHAPFTFDLSVFDLYAAFIAGASVTLIPEGVAPARGLVEMIAGGAITVWYSVPSALVLMMDHGGLLERDLPKLRAIVFAGEPFPVKPLRRLRKRFSGARLFNFYGPTETNVCTAYEVRALAEDRLDPVPIGTACSGDRVSLRPLRADEAGERFALGPDVGELIVEGPTVMLGYWGRPPQVGPYRTGDVCRRLADGTYEYLGRFDDMVKVRGHRIELGEIETTLRAHPLVDDVAVVVSGAGIAGKLVAFVVGRDVPSLVALKVFAADRLPKHMIVDEVRSIAELPRTRNGKINRAELVRRVGTTSPSEEAQALRESA